MGRRRGGTPIVEQPYLLRQARIDALEFFTPARQYFQASVSLYDEKELIIFFRPDPGPESPFLLQGPLILKAARYAGREREISAER